MADNPEQEKTGAVTDPSPSVSDADNKENRGVSGGVETSEKQHQGAQEEDTAAKNREGFFKRQTEKKEKVSELEVVKGSLTELSSKFDTLMQKLADQESLKKDDTGSTSTGDGGSDNSIEARVAAQFNKQLQSVKLQSDIAEAENWGLSRSHVKSDPKAQSEIAAIMEMRYADEAKRNPKGAIKLAYIDWAAMKGVQPDLGIEVSASGGKAGGTSPSGAAASSGFPTNLAQAANYINQHKYGSADWVKAVNEVDKARKEGRIK